MVKASSRIRAKLETGQQKIILAHLLDSHKHLISDIEVEEMENGKRMKRRPISHGKIK
jgi:hypothetical protein